MPKIYFIVYPKLYLECITERIPKTISFSVSIFQDTVRHLLSDYLCRFSAIAGPAITCGPVLNW